MNARYRPRIGPAIGMLLMLVLIAGSALAMSPGAAAKEARLLLVPTLVEGNTSCAAQGYAHGFKIEPGPFAGTYDFPNDPDHHLTIVTADDITFDWASTLGIDAVIVKAGSASAIYSSNPEATSGAGLHGEYRGFIPAISHLEFCYDYEVEVEKSVVTAFTRTWSWTIEKGVDRDRIDMFVGEAAQDATYTVGVVRTATDSDFTATGAIVITNPDPTLTANVSVSDVMASMPVTVSCPSTSIAPLGTMTCAFDADFGDIRPAPGDNVATVTTTGGVAGGMATAYYAFADESTSEVTFAGPASIDVTDTNGKAWSFGDSGAVSYAVAYACADDEGSHRNVAAITQTGDAAEATVDIFCHELGVAKDASTSFTRTWDWAIAKSVDPAAIDLFVGDTAPATWTVTVDKTGFTDSGWDARGTITVTNPAPVAVRVDRVTDTIDGGTASVDCGPLPVDLAPGGTLTCSWQASLPDASDRLNTVVVDISTPNGGVATFQAQADVRFGEPTTLVDAEIDVADNNGFTWHTGDSASWSYKTPFACGADGQMTARETYANTATIVQTGTSASSAVTVTCYELAISKTADTRYTRTFPWTIAKSVSPEQQDLRFGDVGVANYTIDVARGEPIDSDWMVFGTILVTNPAPIDAVIVGVADEIDDVAVAVDCGVAFPYTLPAGGALRCTYEQPMLSAETRINRATATMQNTPAGVTSIAGSAAVVFGEPTTVIGSEVDVADSNLPGAPIRFSESGQVTYAVDLPCVDVDGSEHTFYTRDNTATIVETGATANAELRVDCWNLSITKSVETSFVRTWQWEIAKSASPDSLALFEGDSGTVDYTVSVVRTGYVDSGWEAHGTITVYNEAPIPAVVTDVTDLVMSGNDVVSVVKCQVAFPMVMEPETSFTCRYDADLPGEGNYIDRSVAVYENTPAPGTTEFAYDLPFDFSDAVIYEVDATITVDDTNGNQWIFSDSGAVTYGWEFACNADDGGHRNAVTILETGQSAVATVLVTCYDLVVTKDATTSLDRTWTWTIDKSSAISTLTLASPDQSIMVAYDAAVAATSQDSNWAVTGTITITNPAPRAATIAGVRDIVSADIAPAVDCGVTFPAEIPAGGSMTCSYTASLPDASDRTNTATATLVNHHYETLMTGEESAVATGTTDYSGAAAVAFAEPTVEQIDECISVRDDKAGYLGDVCATGAPKTFSYTLTVGPYQACGQYDYTNTATVTTTDTQTTVFDTWVIVVDVPCNGCTLTLGYWKTHSIYGPAPKTDDGWTSIGDVDGDGAAEGPDELFFTSGKTWLQILNTASAGDQYLNLARQYVAARLNIANGVVSPPASVTSAMAAATTYFQSQPAGITSGKLPKTLQTAPGILDQFNRGLIGPGHCSE